MPSQGDESGDLSCLDWAKQYIKEKYDKPGDVFLALLHRLDRPVGGVIAFGRTSKAASRMSDLFRKREIKKSYLAITEGIPNPEAGSLKHHLKKMPGKNIVRAYHKFQHGSKEAITHYQVLQKQGDRALLKIELETGRRHQIRVQLADNKTGIVGDKKYAITDFLPDKSIALFAHRLEFVHPVKKEPVKIEAPYPSTGPWADFNFG